MLMNRDIWVGDAVRVCLVPKYAMLTILISAKSSFLSMLRSWTTLLSKPPNVIVVPAVMHTEFSYTWKTTIFTFLCILALSTAYSQSGYASAQGYTSTTLALSDVILPRDWSLFL